MATVNPVIRRGSTQDRNRQEEQDGNPQTNDDKMVTWQGPSQRFEPATDWDRETNLTTGRRKIAHRGLINSQENDQQRQSSITYRVCWRLVY